MKKILALILAFCAVFASACSQTTYEKLMNTRCFGYFETLEESVYSISTKSSPADIEAETSHAYFLGYYIDGNGEYSTKISGTTDGFTVVNTFNFHGSYRNKNSEIIGEEFDDYYQSIAIFKYDGTKFLPVSCKKTYKNTYVEVKDSSNMNFLLHHVDFEMTTDYGDKKASLTIENAGEENQFFFKGDKLSATHSYSQSFEKMLIDDEYLPYVLRCWSVNSNFGKTNTTPVGFSMIDKINNNVNYLTYAVSEEKLNVSNFEFDVQGVLQAADSSIVKELTTSKVSISIDKTEFKGPPLIYWILKNDKITDGDGFISADQNEINFARIVKMEQGRMVYNLTKYTNKSRYNQTTEE